MTDRGIVVTRFLPSDLTALDAAVEVFGCTRAELVHHVVHIFCAGVAMIGPPPVGSRLENLAFQGEWRRE